MIPDLTVGNVVVAICAGLVVGFFYARKQGWLSKPVFNSVGAAGNDQISMRNRPARSECLGKFRDIEKDIDVLQDDRTTNKVNINNLGDNFKRLEGKIDDNTKEIFLKLDSLRGTQIRVEALLTSIDKQNGKG